MPPETITRDGVLYYREDLYQALEKELSELREAHTQLLADAQAHNVPGDDDL